MSAPSPIAFETRVESTRRILTAPRWEFSIWNDSDDGEPRIRDVDAAARLGYVQPRSVRKLIQRIWPGNQGLCVRSTVERTQMPTGGTRETQVREVWLTEAQLLKLCARSETPIAEAILDEMIQVFIAVRRHLLSPVPVAANEPDRSATGSREGVGFVPSERVMKLAQRLAPVCRATPEELLATPLEAWASEMESHIQSGGMLTLYNRNSSPSPVVTSRRSRAARYAVVRAASSCGSGIGSPRIAAIVATRRYSRGSIPLSSALSVNE